MDKQDAFEYHPLAPTTLEDPHAAYKQLRSIQGLYWHEGMRSYVASRYEPCKRVLTENAYFAKDRRRIGQEIPDNKLTVQTEDPPNRLGLRQDFRRALNEENLKEMCDQVAARFLARLNEAPTHFDFVSEVGYPTALDLTTTVVGLTTEQGLDYLTCHRPLLRATDAGLDPERLPEGRRAGALLQKLAAEWLEQESIEKLLVPARDFAQQYPSDYAKNTLAGMVNASFSTAASFTTGIVNTLVKSEDARARAAKAMKAGHGYRVVSEFLRYLSPAQATNRVVVKACELEGVQLQRGDTVVTLMGSANRDPEVYKDPDTLHFDRANNRHLAFAAGPHLCLGKKLAEEWGQALLRTVLGPDSLLGNLSVGAPEYLDSATVRSISRLPVQRI